MRIRLAVSLCAVVALSELTAWAADGEHPFIKPYPGQVLKGKPQLVAFDAVDWPTGPGPDKRRMQLTHLEGRISNHRYSNPAGRSDLEISENYREGLERASFEIVHYCKGNCAGWGGTKYLHPSTGGVHYLAAKLVRPEGDVWVGVRVAEGTQVVVAEVKPMETGKVQVTAEVLGDDLSRKGHVAIYGIYFDTDKAMLKPESAPVLSEIAKLLQKSAELKIWIVGHTDAQGTYQHNLDLSKRRAEAVMAELSTKYKVAGARMQAGGVGPLAPVASNKTEEGRAKNRRVELVEQ